MKNQNIVRVLNADKHVCARRIFLFSILALIFAVKFNITHRRQNQGWKTGGKMLKKVDDRRQLSHFFN